MSKTVLIIMAHKAVESNLNWMVPVYQKAGCDMIGVGHTNTELKWPAPIKTTLRIGEDIGGTWNEHRCANVIRRLTEVFHYCYKTLVGSYTDFCVIEYDVGFFQRLPEHTGGLLTNYGGSRSTGFKSPCFFHAPWWADVETAGKIVDIGYRLIWQGDWEHGAVDRFIGLVTAIAGIKWTRLNAYTENALDTNNKLARARKAIQCGAICVHGIKTESQLKYLTT